MIDARILVVGAEGGIARGWVDHLRGGGANITVVGDGAGALRHLDVIEPEVVLIDVHLSGGPDGFDTCRALRSRSGAVILLATANSSTYEEVVALTVGADAYVHEDVPVEVLAARLRTLVRRARGVVVVGAGLDGREGGRQQSPRASVGQRGAVNGRVPAGVGSRMARQGASSNGGAWHGAPLDGAAETIVEGDLEIDLVAREVHVAGRTTELTRIEFDLLVTLARQPRRVFTREQLMASAWDEPFDGSHVLDTHLSRLRGKITESGGERVAHAVRGVGYRLRT